MPESWEEIDGINDVYLYGREEVDLLNSQEVQISTSYIKSLKVLTPALKPC